MPRHVARGAKAVGAKILHPGQPPDVAKFLNKDSRASACQSWKLFFKNWQCFFEAAEIIQYQFCLQTNSNITIDSIDHNINTYIYIYIIYHNLASPRQLWHLVSVGRSFGSPAAWYLGSAATASSATAALEHCRAAPASHSTTGKWCVQLF